MPSRVTRFLHALRQALHAAEAGQGLVEYAALIGFVAACMVVAELFLQPGITTALNNVANSFPH